MHTRIEARGIAITVQEWDHDSMAQDIIDLVYWRNKRQWARGLTRALAVAFGHPPKHPAQPQEPSHE